MLHKVPFNTFAPQYSTPAAKTPKPQTRAEYAKAPSFMGFGRPAQSHVGQP